MNFTPAEIDRFTRFLEFERLYNTPQYDGKTPLIQPRFPVNMPVSELVPCVNTVPTVAPDLAEKPAPMRQKGCKKTVQPATTVKTSDSTVRKAKILEAIATFDATKRPTTARMIKLYIETNYPSLRMGKTVSLCVLRWKKKN